MASYFFSCRSHCHCCSLTHSHVVVVVIVIYCSIRIQIPFYQFYLSLLQAEKLRLRSRALSHGALSRTRALLCMLSLIFVCLRLQPVTAFGTLPQPSALSAVLCIHSLTVVRFICLRRLVRLTLTQPSGCLRSLSAAACAECAIDLGDIVAGVVDIVSRLRTFNANARGICSRSTRLASFAAAAASASASAE